MLRFARLLLLALAVPIVALGLFEVGARLLWGDAREVLALYQADPQLGVRLAPGAQARLKSREGRVTQIDIGPDGFRQSLSGADCPSPGEQTRVLLLGDSQVFGYHVQADETLAAQLNAALGPRHMVKSGAVPTYGPHEYVEVLKQQIARCAPDAVWWVVNETNDHAEAITPNRRRVTAEAGYARRTVGHKRDGLSLWMAKASAHSAAAYHLWRAASVARAMTTGTNAHNLSFVAARPDDEVAQSTDATLAHIETARALCRQAGCQLHVAILPPDVLVDDKEAAKYHVAPEAAGLRRYTDRLLAKLAGRGVVVDLTETLQQHSPGAFWSDDPHLSPRGHRAVAVALARAMSRVMPPAPTVKLAAHEVTP